MDPISGIFLGVGSLISWFVGWYVDDFVDFTKRMRTTPEHLDIQYTAPQKIECRKEMKLSEYEDEYYDEETYLTKIKDSSDIEWMVKHYRLKEDLNRKRINQIQATIDQVKVYNSFAKAISEELNPPPYDRIDL